MKRTLVVTIGFLFFVSSAEGKIRTSLELHFVPTQTVAEARATIDPAMLDRPVTVRVADARDKDPDWVGTRMDDDDRVFDLRATNVLLPWTEEAVTQSLRRWDLRVESSSELVFVATLMQFQVEETDQALGSVYKARVQLTASLETSGGGTLWSGSASGDASRYGRSRSDDNCNEVLSDSLLEAVANAVSQQSLHDAWARPRGGDPANPGQPAARAGTSAARRHTPAALLEEVRSLVDGGFDRSTLLQFVNQQALSEPFTAEDLRAWKAAGIPQDLIQAALRRPVQ